MARDRNDQGPEYNWGQVTVMFILTVTEGELGLVVSISNKIRVFRIGVRTSASSMLALRLVVEMRFYVSFFERCMRLGIGKLGCK